MEVNLIDISGTSKHSSAFRIRTQAVAYNVVSFGWLGTKNSLGQLWHSWCSKKDAADVDAPGGCCCNCQIQGQAPLLAPSLKLLTAWVVMSFVFASQLLPDQNGRSFGEQNPSNRVWGRGGKQPLGLQVFGKRGDLPLGEPERRRKSCLTRSLWGS